MEADALLNQAEAALKDVEAALHGPKTQAYRLEELVGEGGQSFDGPSARRQS
jgi:hypothetical protein